jgi:hypothetical protein
MRGGRSLYLHYASHFALVMLWVVRRYSRFAGVAVSVC